MRKKVLDGLTLAALVLIGWALGSRAWAEPNSPNRAVASITRFTGEVRIQQHGQWIPAYRSAFLFNGDQVMTGKGRAEVQFTDGSIVTLTQFCAITLRAEVGDESWLGLVKREVSKRTVALTAGKLWFDIRPQEGIETALETPTVVCGILGTAGELGHDARQGSVVGLSRGLAKVMSKASRQSVRLRANQRTRVTWEGPPQPPESYTPTAPPSVDVPASAIPATPEPLLTGEEAEPKQKPGAGEQPFQVTLPPPPTGGTSGSGNVSP